MKKIALIMLICAGFVNIAYGQEATPDDPFDSLLPAQEANTEGTTTEAKVVAPPPITIQGILWGTAMPEAIIDGKVYKVGDSLKDMDGKIYKIEKNTVSVFYEGRLFEMGVSKKEAK